MKRTILLTLYSVASLIVTASVCFAADCAVISVYYNERVPYLTLTDDVVEGLTGTPAALAFQHAGIPFRWKKMSSKRQMIILKNNEGCDCLVGWFKNPEREQFATYTHPIYQDQPQIALARADNDALQTDMSVDAVLSNPDLKLEVKDGYSYGPFLDAKIAQHAPTMIATTAENITMLKMIHLKRVDYFFIAPEEADGLIASSGLPKEDFHYIRFSDMPEGEKRYILCSKRVGNDVIEKLNAAIQK